MEAEYLRATVGEALASGMAHTAMANPSDPVDHLANWLHKYCDNIEVHAPPAATAHPLAARTRKGRRRYTRGTRLRKRQT